VSSTKRPDQRVAVVIPAKDEAERIATTVRACRSIPRVDLGIVVSGTALSFLIPLSPTRFFRRG